MDDFLCPQCAQEAGQPYAFGPPLPVPKLTRRPKLQYVTALLAEADEIGVDTPEADLIRQIEMRANEWQSRARQLLCTSSLDSHEWHTAAKVMVKESEALEVRA